MNKELSPLGALYNLYEISDGYQYIGVSYEKEFDIIETALKEYELMKQTKFIVADKKISDDDLKKLKNQRMFVSNLEQCEIKPLFDEEEQKKLKALDIIKEKQVQVDWFIHCVKNFGVEGLHYYNSAFVSSVLTQKEYDLLKEVLL